MVLYQKPSFLGEGASLVVTGDLRNSGALDLVTGSFVNSVGVRLGNGNGTFGSRTTFPVPGSPLFLGLGDFYNNGFLDAVVADKSEKCECITVLPGNGNGTFGHAIETQSPYPLAVFGVGDFNGDGNLDIATVGQFGGSSEVGILLGNGDGTLSGRELYGLRWAAVGCGCGF
jgi:FG-GAP-like repeat